MLQLVRIGVLSLAATALFSMGSLSRAATPPAETLLPANTRGFVTVPNTPDALKLWKESLAGRLLDDPVMDPFIQDLRRQLEQKWREEHTRLGFKWDDLRPAVSGELSFGVIHQEGKQAGLIMLADVTGHEEEAKKLLATAEKSMQVKKAKRTAQTIAGVQVTIYDEPRKPDDPANLVRRSVYFLSQNVLGASNQVEAATAVLTRLAGKGEDNLAGVASYRAVLARCEKDGGKATAQARWWIDPLGCLAAGQAGIPADKRREPDLLKLASKVGFNAIKGAGGTVQLGGRQNLLARTFIYAPKPWLLSMNMFAFQSGAAKDFAPQAWIPQDVASYTTFKLDIKTAEANFEPLFNQLFGEGEPNVWTDVKESLRDDPNGPGLDIVKDLIAHLGTRLTMVSDYTSPTTLDCERTCMIIEVANEKALAASIQKSMEPDPNVRKHEFEGHVIWEMLEEDIEGPAVEREEVPAKEGAAGKVEEKIEEELGGGEGGLMPRSSVSVANGHLFVASSVPFLQKLLSKRDAAESLEAAAEYKLVTAEIERLYTGPQSFRFFSRVDEVVRPHFDLVKENQMPQAKTSLANAINRVMNGTRDRTEIRKPEIDGTKLPDFEKVRKYFGVGGGVAVTEDDGWYILNFTVDPNAAGAPGEIGRAAGLPAR